MSNQVNAKAGLSVKDLVTTGIFTALLFVFIMVGGVFFATNPVLTFFMPAGSALLAGPIYLLMIAKVHKRWSVTIMGVIMAIIWFVTGMHWAFALGYLIMAVVADFVAGTKQYKSKKINSLSYILFSLGGFLSHPGMTVECIYVPLLMMASKAADELSIASVTRGIENPNHRTCLVQIKCGIADWTALLIAVAFFIFELCKRGGVIG